MTGGDRICFASETLEEGEDGNFEGGGGGETTAEGDVGGDGDVEGVEGRGVAVVLVELQDRALHVVGPFGFFAA